MSSGARSPRASAAAAARMRAAARVESSTPASSSAIAWPSTAPWGRTYCPERPQAAAGQAQVQLGSRARGEGREGQLSGLRLPLQGERRSSVAVDRHGGRPEHRHRDRDGHHRDPRIPSADRRRRQRRQLAPQLPPKLRIRTARRHGRASQRAKQPLLVPAARRILGKDRESLHHLPLPGRPVTPAPHHRRSFPVRRPTLAVINGEPRRIVTVSQSPFQIFSVTGCHSSGSRVGREIVIRVCFSFPRVPHFSCHWTGIGSSTAAQCPALDVDCGTLCRTRHRAPRT